MKRDIKFIRVIFIVNFIFGVLVYPDYVRVEAMTDNSTIPESVPVIHFFLESFNSKEWIWFFRGVVIVCVLIALLSYIYFLNYKKKQEKNEFFDTLGIDFIMQDEGRKE